MAGNLTRDEARDRSRLLTVSSYEIELDLTAGPDRFGSTTVVRFRCAEPGAATFCELADAEVREATLNGAPVRYDRAADRLILTGLAAENECHVGRETTQQHVTGGIRFGFDGALLVPELQQLQVMSPIFKLHLVLVARSIGEENF